jgi:hypothetical protein
MKKEAELLVRRVCQQQLESSKDDEQKQKDPSKDVVPENLFG